jgi:hypothetical protein
MAMTGFYRTMKRPRTSRPLSMMKYDPVGTFDISYFLGLGEEDGVRRGNWWMGGIDEGELGGWREG